MAEEGGYIPLPSSDQSRSPNLLHFDTFDHTTALTAPQQKDWLCIDAHGNLELVKASSGRALVLLGVITSSQERLGFVILTLGPAKQVDKHAMVADLGIHYRDLRTVDPLVRASSKEHAASKALHN